MYLIMGVGILQLFIDNHEHIYKYY